MAQLGNTVILGSLRCLNKIYTSDLDVANGLTLTSLTVSGASSFASATFSGTTTFGASATFNGGAYFKFGGIEIYHSSTPFIDFHYANSTADYTSRIIESSSGTLNIHGTKFVKSGSGLQVTGAATFDSNVTLNNSSTLNAPNIQSSFGLFTNLNVLETLKSAKWEIQNIANVGGEFAVTPTIYFSANATVTVNSISGTTVVMTISDATTISSDTMAGFTWTANSVIKVSGSIGNCVLNACPGTITTKLNQTAGTVKITITCDDASLLTTGAYAATDVKDLALMLYRYYNTASTTAYPTGIYLAASSMTTNSPLIDVYNGATELNKPRVRIGYLNGLDSSITVGGVAPSGYGIYTDNGFFNGVIVSTAGQIGGWSIGTYLLSSGAIGTGVLLCSASGQSGTANIAGSGNLSTWAMTASSTFGITHDGKIYASSGKIANWNLDGTSFYTGAYGTNNSAMFCTGTVSSKSIGGSASISGWVLTAGANFGVTKTGDLYGSSAHITGEITATSGKIGNINIGTNAIYSGSKSAYNNTNTGLYLDKDGKVGIGSSTQYIQFDGSNLNLKVKTLTIDGTNAATVSDVENIDVGGVNLAKGTLRSSTPTGYLAFQIDLSENMIQGEEYVLQFWNSSVTRSDKTTAWFTPYWGGGNISLGKMDDDGNGHFTLKFVAPTTDHSTVSNAWLNIYNSPGAGASGTVYAATLGKWKLEKGNMPTDWSPCPADIDTDIADATKTASNYLYYDSTNGLVVSQTGVVATGYNTQITSSGINLRSGSTVLSSLTGTQFTINAGTTGKAAMTLTSSALTFYNPNTTTMAASIGADGLTIKQGNLAGFHVTSTYNRNATSANGGHIYENSIYRHSSDSTYEYEFGMKGDASEEASATSGATNYAFYVQKITKGNTWMSVTPTFHIRHNGALFCTNADITGTVTATAGTIGGCQIVNGKLVIGASNVEENEVIIGTQTAATATFTGVAKFASLTDGREITYWLPYSYSSSVGVVSYTPTGGSAANGAALQLTLSNGTTTAAIPCFYSGSTRLTSHYGIGIIRFVYRENVTIGAVTIAAGWWADANYDSNTYDRSRWTNAVKAAAAITAGAIICGTSSGYKMIANNVAFNISYPILYAGSAIASGNTDTNTYTQVPGANLTVTKSGWSGTNNSTVYIVGTLSGNTFTVNSTVMTTTVPTASDNLYYIPIGITYSTTNIYFYSQRDIYAFYDGKFQPIGAGASDVVKKWSYNGDTTYIDGGDIYTNTVTADKISVTDLQAIGATIGGFAIDTTSIHTKNVAVTSNADNSIALSSADFTRTINSESRTGLRFAIGDKFGVTGDGILYTKDAVVAGSITATGGTIGGMEINANTLSRDWESEESDYYGTYYKYGYVIGGSTVIKTYRADGRDISSRHLGGVIVSGESIIFYRGNDGTPDSIDKLVEITVEGSAFKIKTSNGVSTFQFNSRTL